MARHLLLLAVLLGGCSGAVTAQQSTSRPPAPDAGSNVYDTAQNVYVVVYRRGPKFDPAKGLDNAGISEHIRHFQSLGDRLVGAGTVEQTGDDLLGYVILRARDQAAADAWLARDPAVIAGSMLAQLRRWGVTDIKGWTKAQTGTGAR